MIILGYWNEQGETPGHDTTRQLKLIAPASRQRQIYRGNRHYLQTCTSTCALSSLGSLELDFRTFNAGFTPAPHSWIYSRPTTSSIKDQSYPYICCCCCCCCSYLPCCENMSENKVASVELRKVLRNSLFLCLAEPYFSTLIFGIDIFNFYDESPTVTVE